MVAGAALDEGDRELPLQVTRCRCPREEDDPPGGLELSWSLVGGLLTNLAGMTEDLLGRVVAGSELPPLKGEKLADLGLGRVSVSLFLISLAGSEYAKL